MVTSAAGSPDSTHVGEAWEPVPGYLNTSTLGLPPRSVVQALQQSLSEWQAGSACPVRYDGLVGARADGLCRSRGCPGRPRGRRLAAATDVFAGLDMAQVRDHDVRLANLLRDRMGLAQGDTPVLALDDPDGSRIAALESAGVQCASRAGRVRLSFHTWNTEADVDLVVDAVS